jgi:hypothetical protein
VRVEKRHKLHLAAGEDAELRLNVLRVAEGRILATDGTIAASVPAGIEPGENLADGTLISPRAWEHAARGSRGTGTLRLEPDGRQVATSGVDGPRMSFPPSASSTLEVPSAELLIQLAEESLAGSVEITLDAEALYRLARALGSDELRIRFVADEKGRAGPEPAEVSPAGGGPERGAIMPVIMEGH